MHVSFAMKAIERTKRSLPSVDPERSARDEHFGDPILAVAAYPRRPYHLTKIGAVRSSDTYVSRRPNEAVKMVRI
ncbi:hypothetical protein [Flavisphingomonas formosensis]|uniref:hypothetical protein n=1 Tax=Flavisphingomonas formosensis TaxID=861534 RepID=UPI0018DF39D0|nr:hypothetical protein [Sphingomonas formosensis]